MLYWDPSRQWVQGIGVVFWYIPWPKNFRKYPPENFGQSRCLNTNHNIIYDIRTLLAMASFFFLATMNTLATNVMYWCLVSAFVIKYFSKWLMYLFLGACVPVMSGNSSLIFRMTPRLNWYVAQLLPSTVDIVSTEIVDGIQVIDCITSSRQTVWWSLRSFRATLALQPSCLHGNSRSMASAKSSKAVQRMFCSSIVRPQTGQCDGFVDLRWHSWQKRWSKVHWRIGGTMYWPQTRHSYKSSSDCFSSVSIVSENRVSVRHTLQMRKCFEENV